MKQFRILIYKLGGIGHRKPTKTTLQRIRALQNLIKALILMVEISTLNALESFGEDIQASVFLLYMGIESVIMLNDDGLYCR